MYSSKHPADIENRCQKIVKPNKKKSSPEDGNTSVDLLILRFVSNWGCEDEVKFIHFTIITPIVIHDNDCNVQVKILRNFHDRDFQFFMWKCALNNYASPRLNWQFREKLNFCSQHFLLHFLCSHSYHDIMRVEKPFQSNWQQEKMGFLLPERICHHFFPHRLKQTREFWYSLNDNVTQCLS